MGRVSIGGGGGLNKESVFGGLGGGLDVRGGGRWRAGAGMMRRGYHMCMVEGESW